MQTQGFESISLTFVTSAKGVPPQFAVLYPVSAVAAPIGQDFTSEAAFSLAWKTRPAAATAASFQSTSGLSFSVENSPLDSRTDFAEPAISLAVRSHADVSGPLSSRLPAYLLGCEHEHSRALPNFSTFSVP
jgi:hypothetical protein